MKSTITKSFFLFPFHWQRRLYIHNLGAIAIFFACLKIFRPRQQGDYPAGLLHGPYHRTVMLVSLFTEWYWLAAYYAHKIGLGSRFSRRPTLIRSWVCLTAIMICASLFAMTAETGILRISEQIDALYTMRIDPLRYPSPRTAAVIVSPLTAFSIWSNLGGYVTEFSSRRGWGAHFYRIHYVEMAT